MNLRVANLLGTGDPSATERFLRTDAPKGRWLALCGASLATMDGHAEAAEWALSNSLRDHVSPESLNNFANVLVRLGKFDEADVAYERLMSSGILYWDSLRNLALVHEARRNWRAAFFRWHDLRMACPARMTDEDWFRYVTCAFQAGFPAKARHELRWIQDRFSRRNPSPWNASWENLCGAASLADGDRSSARKHFEKALEMDPGHVNAAKNLQALRP